MPPNKDQGKIQHKPPPKPQYKLGRAAELLGVSVDKIRSWVDAGDLPATRTAGGHRLIDGTDLARFCRQLAQHPSLDNQAQLSARNRFVGLVTDVVSDSVVAKVEIQAGSHRLVSLLTKEAVDELGLEPGVVAVAAVKSTNVVIELGEA